MNESTAYILSLQYDDKNPKALLLKNASKYKISTYDMFSKQYARNLLSFINESLTVWLYGSIWSVTTESKLIKTDQKYGQTLY